MRTKAIVRLKLPSKQQTQIVLNSLKPEIRSPTTTRARSSLTEEDGLLVLKIEAKDTTALRASLNAYLRWINSIINVFDVLAAQQP